MLLSKTNCRPWKACWGGFGWRNQNSSGKDEWSEERQAHVSMTGPQKDLKCGGIDCA